MQSVCPDHCLINEFNLAASKKPLNILGPFGLLHLCQVSDQLMRGYQITLRNIGPHKALSVRNIKSYVAKHRK